MVKHIGIVACSTEGAALCWRTISAEGADLLGKHTYPEITVHGFPLALYMKFIEADDWRGVADLMVGSAEKVAQTGASFAICPDNTIHRAFDFVVKRSPIPWLHIAEEVAKVARNREYMRLGILGTRYLMEGPVYPEKLEAFGIDWRVPDPDVREEINDIIFDELVQGKFTSVSRAFFSRTIQSLKDRGCDAVVLGCTEIPLIISQEDSVLPILDSTRTLARAALRHALNGK